MGLNWLDIVILIVFVLISLDGMAKGLVYSLFNIIGIFISLFLAQHFSKNLAHYVISNTSIYNSLKAAFEKRSHSLSQPAMSIIGIFNTGGKSIEEILTIAFINIACFLVIFFISTIIVNLLRDSIKSIVKNTPIKYLDKIGGLAIGAVKALILIFLFFAVTTPMIGLFPKNSSFVLAISTSKLSHYFHMYNFIIPKLQNYIYL